MADQFEFAGSRRKSKIGQIARLLIMITLFVVAIPVVPNSSWRYMADGLQSIFGILAICIPLILGLRWLLQTTFKGAVLCLSFGWLLSSLYLTVFSRPPLLALQVSSFRLPLVYGTVGAVIIHFLLVQFLVARRG